MILKKLTVLLAISFATLASNSTTALAAFDCKDGSIKIGFAKAQTGFFAFFDNTGAQGAIIAADIANETGGVDGCPIEILQSDTRSDPSLSRQAAEELISQGASIIVTPGDFDIGVGASLAAQDAGLFSISFEASSSAWGVAIGPNHVTAAITEDDQGRAMAAFSIKRGWESPYLVTNNAFNVFTATEDAFLKYYTGKPGGRDIVADDSTDYSAVVSKIRAAGPSVDFVFLNDYFPHVGTFIRQLRAAGVTLPVLGNQNYSTPAMTESLSAEGLTDVFYIAQGFYEGPSASAAAVDFTTRYKAKFGQFPENANALAGFEGMSILIQGLEEAGSTDAAALTAAITGGTNQELATSTIYKWENHHPSRSAAVIGFDDGKFALVDTVDTRTVTEQ